MGITRPSNGRVRRGRPLVWAGLLLGLMATPAWAASLKHTAAPADLAPLGETALATLDDEAAAVQAAEDELTRRTTERAQGEQEVTAAKASLKAAKAALKAKKAEKKAAETSKDRARVNQAEDAILAAEAHVERQKARVAWAKAELNARTAREDAAEADVALAQAELELARVRLLAASQSPAAEAYKVRDFGIQAEKKRVISRDNHADAVELTAKADALLQPWDPPAAPSTAEATPPAETSAAPVEKAPAPEAAAPVEKAPAPEVAAPVEKAPAPEVAAP